ncbi:MAG: winged helix family transcriptional regulator [Propionibacteriales bacterium]|nr:winged helix family transcriptional regulator [Propionibacteriales bacterium]
MLKAQDVEIDVTERVARRQGRELPLTAKEFDLLCALIRRAGEIVSREDLMHDVWHTTFWTSTKTIDVHLGWLRRKLGDDAHRPRYITTVRGRGLRFELAPPGVDVSQMSESQRMNTNRR